MSLFPAYSNIENKTQNVETTTASSSNTVDENYWLTNPSFQMPPSATINDSTESMSVEIYDQETNSDSTSKKSKKHSKKKKKKEHKLKKDKRSKSKSDSEPKIEFTGKEDYYVDKKPNNSYFSMVTLKKEDHSRYRCQTKFLGTKQWRISQFQSKEKSKRYFHGKSKKLNTIGSVGRSPNKETNKIIRLSETEFTLKTKEFNQNLQNNNKNIPMWLDYVRLQENFYMKMTKIQLAERKMDILNKALRENPSNEALYREYISILEQTYPSFEISKFLDILLQKDPANYHLWNAQIMATQGSMARCKIPDVLELYEKCMKNMYKRNRCDEVTLRLFSSCALFLRQSGLNEQFYALISLALELNVCENKFMKIQPNESDHNTLIEYEEIVLKSGLPMNEIWLRIEKLRQNYYFLPVPADRSCSDPQRIVLNEDIFHYIYPLSNREYAFNLVIVVLRLLKIPLVDNFCLKSSVFSSYEAADCDNLCDFDCIEEISSIFLAQTILNSDKSFDDILWTMIRDFSIGPSFITTHIGHELYIKYLGEVLLLCAECFHTTNSTNSPSSFKRNIFILLLLRLERVILAYDAYKNKWTDDKTKKLRNKIKNLLKRDENRNCLVFYVEYARIECDLKRFQQAENIFMTAIAQCNPLVDDDCTRSDYWYAYISYVEMLMLNHRHDDALKSLTSLALDKGIDLNQNYGESTYLLASKKLNDRLKNICAIERNVSIMDVVQSFQPDFLISLMKAYIYHILLWRKNPKDVSQQLEILLKSFPEKNIRHKFIREQIYELYINILHYQVNVGQKVLNSENRALIEVINRAVDEFPTNMVILKHAAMCDSQPWYKIRALLTNQQSPIAIIFLIGAAQWRYKKHITPLEHGAHSSNLSVSGDFNGLPPNVNDIENAYKIRVTNLLRTVTDYDAPTKKNSLLWRLYLRSLLDVTNDFEKSRNLLLTALNECPWNKALYLDGTVYVPQELAHLQDLLIEKQLRIYAMPEELEILRNFDEPQ